MNPSPRDERLGRMLRELRVPEHGPGFWEQFEAKVAGPSKSPRRLRRRPWQPLLAASAVLAVLAGIFIGVLPGTPARPALAEIVKQRVAGAMDRLHTIEGEAVLHTRLPAIVARTHQQPRASTLRVWFAFAADGSFRTRALDGSQDVAYDAGTGIEREVTTSASLGFGRFFVEQRGLAPGPPDQGPEPLAIEPQLGAVVHALLAARDPGVRPVTYRGRLAWQVTFRQTLPDREGVVASTVTVDQRTGLPVAVHQAGSPASWGSSDLRITRLQVNRPLPPRTFTITFPAGAAVTQEDIGFRRVALERAASLAGYKPLVPPAPPGGLRLSQVSFAPRAAATAGTNPPSRKVVSLAYRRGFEQAIITTRQAGASPGRWRDPFQAPGGPAAAIQRVTLTGGALRGDHAEVVVAPGSPPYLWAVGHELVVTIAGDLTVPELIHTAESLQPFR